MPTLRVTKRARDVAKEALKEREIASEKFGLSKKERVAHISSGEI